MTANNAHCSSVTVEIIPEFPNGKNSHISRYTLYVYYNENNRITTHEIQNMKAPNDTVLLLYHLGIQHQ